MSRSARSSVKWWHSIFLAVAYAAVLYVPSDVRATETIDNFALSPEQLLNATVTSVSKTSEKLIDAPAAIFVLSNEDILRSGATSIPEALRLVPGVQVARDNAGIWAVSVRGFNGSLDDKLLVLIDGRPVYDPLFAGVYWDIQDMVLEDIDRIEVIRGPGASLWGANAVNGVINIITKKAKDTQGNLASVTAGNQNGIVEERYGGKLSDNGFYRVYAKYVDRQDNQTPTGANAHDGQVEDRSGFRADWKGTGDANDDFTFQGDVYRSDAGQIRTVPILNSSARLTTAEDLLSRGGNMLGRWTRTLTDDSKFTMQSYMDYTGRDQELLKDQRSTFDVDAQYELPQMDRHKIIVGGGYRYSVDSLTSPTPLVTFTDIGEKTQLFSSFVQDKITLVPKDWFLTLGSKLEHNDYTGFELEPNARLQWHIDDQQMAWSSVSRSVRTPSRLEEALHIVQAAVPGVSLDTLPNPSLNSEELIAYELGYRRQWTRDVSSDVATFYNVYHGLSTFTFDGLFAGTNPARTILALSPTNSTSASTWGGEVATDWRATDQWKLSASYSLLIMELHGPAGDIAGGQEPETQSPNHQINLRSQWDITKDLSFDTMFYYVSEVPDYNVKKTFRLDTRLGWRIMDGLQFDLVGQDLLDPHRHEIIMPGNVQVAPTDINRSVYGKFTWRF